MEQKISVWVVKMLNVNSTDKELYDARSGPLVEGPTLVPISMLNKEWLSLPISEIEWQKLGDGVAKQGGMKQKMPYEHDFKVIKWEYYPSLKKAVVYVYNDLQ